MVNGQVKESEKKVPRSLNTWSMCKGKKLKKKGIEVRSGFWPLNSLKNFNSQYVTDKDITKKIFEKRSHHLELKFKVSEKVIRKCSQYEWIPKNSSSGGQA